MAMAGPSTSFERHGHATPASPVILSAPHAGRDYPLALRAALRVPVQALTPLEDRHADALALAALGGEILFVQRRARAWIDLNRSESERDPKLDDGARANAQPIESAKIRSGLGLVPRRVAAAGDIWRRRLSAEEVEARIANDHRPDHEAVEAALCAARARCGVSVLLDLHSMPPLGEDGARIVLGDRFGRSAASRFVARLEGVARAYDVSCAVNTPYAGGHILDRHGDPESGVHAIQIEFDRSLYLDSRLDSPGAGLAETASLLRALIDSLADEAISGGIALAAE
ncbi:N-formylglutamate amidohydrolase [soil metagenome]